MTHFVRFRKSSEYIRFDAPELDFSGNAFLPTTALVPILQHCGSSAKPVVSPGERIREGQLIARGLSPESANIHSPIPGILQEFRVTPMPDGSMQMAAMINLAGSFDILGRKEENYPWRNVPESELLRVLEDKGTINTFESPVPIVPQLRAAKKNDSPAIALRLFDGDPTCQLDSYLVKTRLDSVLEGCALLARSIDAKKVFLIHSGKKWEGPDQKQLEKTFQERKVRTIRSSNRYPSGNSGQLLKLLKANDSDKSLSDPVLIDPVTALAAFDAAVKNVPCLNRIIVVTGPAIGNPAILKVRIGTPIGDIIEECGGFKVDPSRIVINGLLGGQSVYDLDTPVTKYMKSLHIMDRDTCPSYTVRNCIHCGRCLQVCPVSIDPQRIASCVRSEKITPKVVESIAECQYCGCCAIVCPSRIPLHHIIREVANRNEVISK